MKSEHTGDLLFARHNGRITSQGQGLHLAPNLTLPLEALTQTFAILAKRGSGKTYTAMVMVEEFLRNNLPVVCVDPVGVMWGLRASADGKGPGLPITILGGEHGDVPLESTAGQAVAEWIVAERQPCVLDLSLFRKGEQTRFMTDLAEYIYHHNRDPLHIVLDEADAFANQKPMPDERRMLGAVEDLVRRGRARGIGLTLVTQRSAVLNKNVLTQTECLVVLKTTGPQDIKAIEQWIHHQGSDADQKKVLSSLPSLPRGTAWFWSPGWLGVLKKVAIRTRDTFDSSATPEAGKLTIKPKELAPVELAALRERIAETIERVEGEDPKKLKEKIIELQDKLAKAPQTQPTTRVEKIIEKIEIPDARAIDFIRKVRDLIATELPKISMGRPPEKIEPTENELREEARVCADRAVAKKERERAEDAISKVARKKRSRKASR